MDSCHCKTHLVEPALWMALIAIHTWRAIAARLYLSLLLHLLQGTSTMKLNSTGARTMPKGATPFCHALSCAFLLFHAWQLGLCIVNDAAERHSFAASQWAYKLSSLKEAKEGINCNARLESSMSDLQEAHQCASIDTKLTRMRAPGILSPLLSPYCLQGDD
eukprot:391106-Pelagomonas_calceolata.AAC.1